MTKRRIDPILWLLFSAGGVMAAVFLPVLIVLFGLAIPLGWVQPDYNHLYAVVSHWFTRLVVLGLVVLMLFHWAHRFKYTLVDGLQPRPPGDTGRRALLRRRAPRLGCRAAGGHDILTGDTGAVRRRVLPPRPLP